MEGANSMRSSAPLPLSASRLCGSQRQSSRRHWAKHQNVFSTWHANPPVWLGTRSVPSRMAWRGAGTCEETQKKSCLLCRPASFRRPTSFCRPESYFYPPPPRPAQRGRCHPYEHFSALLILAPFKARRNQSRAQLYRGKGRTGDA